MPKRFDSFAAFYPVYLRMHDDPTNQRWHFVGNVLGLLSIGAAIGAETWWVALAAPVFAQACSWVGHAVFQRNRPGVFSYPLYGMLGSWRMSWDIARGQLPPDSGVGRATSSPSPSS
jgi:hypothetical protein